MQTRRLGSQGPTLSVIGFGAWEAGGTAWGPNASDDDVVGAMRAAFDAGIDWIDTAEVYGDGVSERLVGRAIAGRHDEVTVATKVAPAPEGSGARPDEIRAACEASLGRLGVEAIDLYQLHWPADDVPVEESWGAMADLVDAGLVRWIGVSNFDRGLIERCEAIRHVDSLQPEFSMLRRREADLIAWCGERGTGVVSYGPLAFGLLTGAITPSTTFAEGDWRGGPSTDPDDADDVNLFAPEVLPRVIDLVERLRPVADRLGAALPQLALAWNVAQPGVTSAIAGTRNADHVRANALAGDLALDDDVLTELDDALREADRAIAASGTA